MGKSLKDDEIVIPQDDTNYRSGPIPPDTPDHMIQGVTVTYKGDTYRYEIVSGSNGTQVGVLKDELNAEDTFAVYTDATGRTITLNDDDVITEYVGDGETLALKPNAPFG
ncbi:hypothetical protein [Natrinema salinisoli]|uniref:hypothetical protein n=1 Tax=Natrinema salinisoli TaxID=2878535 RepID=UPI001CF09109|nr:hypothetical protein [Natrinema salinisoli]